MDVDQRVHWLGQLARLWRDLDALDSGGERARARTRGLDELLAEYQDDLAGAEGRLQEGAARVRAAERETGHREERLAGHEQRRERLRDEDEYGAALKEIQADRSGLDAAEQRLLAAYEEQERLRAGVEAAKQELFAQEKRIQAERERLLPAAGGGEDRRRFLEEQIDLCRAQLPPDLRLQLERLGRKLPLPVVWIDGEACGGCHAAFPRQVGLSIAAGRTVERCQSCGRYVVAHP